METEKEKLQRVKIEKLTFYSKIRKVKCPYLQKEVHFNKDGFNHLLSKSWNRGRSIKEQYVRLKLLPQAVNIVKTSHTLQEFDECQIFVRQKINSRWEKRLKRVQYYVFVAFLKDRSLRLKVIIKEIEGGEPFFLECLSFLENKKTL